MGLIKNLRKGAKLALTIVSERDDPRARARRQVHLGFATKTCATCKHWDKAAFLEFVQTNPIWRQLVNHVTPNQMGAAHRGEVDSDGTLANTPSPGKTKVVNWADFGACHARQEHVDKSFVCEQWA